jgi:predicted small lipoprotein YifL
MNVRIGLSFIACALLGACGQRGALYLPEEDRNVVVTPAQPTATPEDPEEQQRRNNTTAPAR